jgi:N-acyl homoserine lactone hydrolase
MSLHDTSQTSGMTRRSALSLMVGGIAGAVGGGWLTDRAAQTQLGAPALPLPNAVQVPPLSVTTSAGIRIHAIQTGFVAVKRAHRQLVGLEAARLLSIAADATWTSWMPIQTWVIQHPEGVIVVDTGETSRINEPDYANCDPVTGWVYRNNLRFAVTPADEIGAQLAALDIDPADVRYVVQTHLHSDHVGGMSAFPNATFYVPRADYPNSMGTLPCHYPTQFSPRFAEFSAQDLSAIGQGYRLTREGDVLIIPTHGHSMGHQSVLLRDGERDILFAGDTSFDEGQLRDGVVGGIVADVGLARATLTTLQTYVRERPTIYLPTHDPESRRRLAEGIVTVI